jgi:hypothetical protein
MTQAPLSTASQNRLYETDFVAWTDQTAELLKKRQFAELDLEHLIEEVKDLGNSERKQLRSQLTRLLMHSLKWQYQPEKRTVSWEVSIRDARKQIKRQIRDTPSLKNHLTEKLELCYQDAVEDAIDETGLSRDVFPDQCHWTPSEILEPKTKRSLKQELEDDGIDLV